MGSKRLTLSEIQKAYRMYMRNTTTLDISRKLGRDHGAIEKLAKRKGWGEQRVEVHAQVMEKMKTKAPDQIIAEIEKIDKRIAQISEAITAEGLSEEKVGVLLREERERIKMRHQLMGIGEKTPGPQVNVQINLKGMTDAELRALIIEEKDDTGKAKSD